MNINHKILSIPPYISTSWDNISSLKTERIEETINLEILLQNGSKITIPSLDMSTVEKVFHCHAKHLEGSSLAVRVPSSQILSFSNLQLLSTLGSFCEHDPNNSNAPALPKAVLEQFTEVAKSLPIANSEDLPKAEPHCNCPYCQITKAIHQSLSYQDPAQELEEEEVSDKDLSFTSWIIEPLPSNIYKVIDPDNLAEYYLVSLNTPLQCSCGQTHCCHMQAVLRS